jgi:hypothetical protein
MTTVSKDRAHQFGHKFLVHLGIRRMADYLDRMQPCMAFLDVPLVVTHALEQSNVLV